MPVFIRRKPTPREEADYTRYRQLVREDFRECCAYCLLHELLAAGENNFELDHFCPKSMPEFADKINDFYNLYYSCHVCNHTKGRKWPDRRLINIGYRFVDLCVEDFSEHFQEGTDGFWIALTKPGEYTESRLRLNRRHLIEIRALLREIAILRGLDPINWNSVDRESLFRLISPHTMDLLS
jgi:hypothetical protein